MDPNLIYEKTSAGEEAVRQRTRVVQRNTRMVLILVDGKSSVGQLCEKAGNPQLVESALQDLERDGLVALKLARDSVWEQSKKVAEEIRAAAVSRLGKETAPEARPVPPPAPPAMAPAPVVPPPAAPMPEMPVSIAPEPFSIAPMSIAPHSVFPGQGAPSTFGSASPAPVQKSASVETEAGKQGLLQRLKGSTAASRDDDDFSIKEIRRGPRGPFISLPLAIALGVIGVLLLVVAGFALYPYDRHRPGIESALSKIVGLPVTVGEVKAVFSPRMAISVESVKVAGGATAQISHLRLVPEVFSLLGSQPSFSTVELDGVMLGSDALGMLPKAVARAAQGDAPARVHHVLINRLSASVPGITLGDLHSELTLAPGAAPEAVTLASADRSLKFVLKPEGSGFVADVEGYAWRATPESVVQIDSIQGKISWDGRSLTIRSLDVRLFDGAVTGVLLLDGADKPVLSGDLSIARVNARRLGEALGLGGQFEGEVAGTLKFSASAGSWDSLFASAVGDGSISVQRGVLGGFDLVEAVRRGGKTPVRGGSTRYEQLSARLKIGPESVRFSDLALSSGVLRSGGTVEVSRDRKLGGRFDVEMRGSANVVRMQLGVSGSVKEPLLQAMR